MKPLIKLNIAVVFTSLLFSQPSFSQTQGAGNGGDAVVCGQNIYMLDSIESANIGHPISIPSPNETLRSKVETLLDRVHQKDDVMMRKLKAQAEILLADMENFEKTGETFQLNTLFGLGELPNVPDEGATFIPPGCKIEQLIIRTKSPLPNQKKYSIRRDFWKQMSLEEKAAAVMHESVYGHLIDNGVNSSPSARWYNGLIISSEISKMSDLVLSKQMVEYLFTTDTEYRNGYAFKVLPAWERESFGFIYNPLTQVLYAADGSISKIYNADVSPSKQFELIAGVGKKVTFATKIVMDHGEWKSMTVLDSFIFNVDTLETFQDWNHILGGRHPLVRGRDIKKFKNKNILKIEDVRLIKEPNGFIIQSARRIHWKLNILGADMGAVWNESYSHATIQLDANRKIEKIIEAK